MNNISIIGASSFIGQHFLDRILSNKQFFIKVLAHSNRNFPSSDNLEVIKGDLTKKDTLTDLLSTGDTVINFAYLASHSRDINIQAILNLVEACKKAKIKRLIHISTAVVVGRTSSNMVSEQTECNPMNDYEKTKLEIENLLLHDYSNNFEVIILRPTAVFGPVGKNLVKLIEEILYGNKLMSYLKSCLYYDRTMNLVSVYNVIEAIEHIIHTAEIDKQIFILSDDDSSMNNYRAIEKYLMKLLGCKDYFLPVIPFPRWILRSILSLSGKSNINPALKYDNQKLYKIGYVKRIQFENALNQYADWYKMMLGNGNDAG